MDSLPFPLILIPKKMCGASSVGLYMPRVRQFQSGVKLKAAIIEDLANIDAIVLQGLVNDMSHRVFQIIYKHGGFIVY